MIVTFKKFRPGLTRVRRKISALGSGKPNLLNLDILLLESWPNCGLRTLLLQH